MNELEFAKSLMEAGRGDWKPANEFVGEYLSGFSPTTIRQLYDDIEKYKGEKENVMCGCLGLAYAVDRNLFHELEDRYRSTVPEP